MIFGTTENFCSWGKHQTWIIFFPKIYDIVLVERRLVAMAWLPHNLINLTAKVNSEVQHASKKLDNNVYRFGSVHYYCGWMRHHRSDCGEFPTDCSI